MTGVQTCALPIWVGVVFLPPLPPLPPPPPLPPLLQVGWLGELLSLTQPVASQAAHAPGLSGEPWALITLYFFLSL